MCLGPPGDAVVVRGVLQPRGPAAALLLTETEVAALGAGRTPPVHVIVVDRGEFDGRIGRMGGDILLGFNRAVRTTLGVDAGDELEVRLRLQTAPPALKVPPALTAALDGDPAARAGFEGLAPSHRKDYARWVGEAKTESTRDRRVAEAVGRLREGRPRRDRPPGKSSPTRGA